VAAGDEAGEGEDEPFLGAEGAGGEVGFEGAEEGEEVVFGGGGEGHYLADDYIGVCGVGKGAKDVCHFFSPPGGGR
jgi:hypothetical protein